MTRQDLENAIGNISSRHIEEAESYFESSHLKQLRVRKLILIAAIIACFLMLSAFAVTIFSAKYGDALNMGADYLGDGIFRIKIQNLSNHELELQQGAMILDYETKEPLPDMLNSAKLSDTVIPANSTKEITVDFRDVCDVEKLENTSQMYYLRVTNDSFLIGQSWNCAIRFHEAGQPEYLPILNTANLRNVPPVLKPYFKSCTTDCYAFWVDTIDYLELAEQEISQANGNLVRPAAPVLAVDVSKAAVTVDPSHSTEEQTDFIYYNWVTKDGYNKLVGDSVDCKILTFGVNVDGMTEDPITGDTDIEIPVLYIFTYEKSKLQTPQAFTFIRGNILDFQALEDYRIYENDQYICYEMSPLFYSDVESYAECILKLNPEIRDAQQAQERIRNFYNSFRNYPRWEDIFLFRDGQQKDLQSMPLSHILWLADLGREVTWGDMGNYHHYEVMAPDAMERYDTDAPFHLLVSEDTDGRIQKMILVHNVTKESVDVMRGDIEAFLEGYVTP